MTNISNQRLEEIQNMSNDKIDTSDVPKLDDGPPLLGKRKSRHPYFKESRFSASRQ